MKVLLEIKDAKAPFSMELLQKFSCKSAKLTTYKTKVREDVKEAVEKMKLIKEGEPKARNAEDSFHDIK